MTLLRTTTIAQTQVELSRLRAQRNTIALVPTMGALHEGHLSLVRMAADLADQTVVTLFVNPRQFDQASDLDAYPRDLEGDERALAALGDEAPAVLFVPSVDEVYPRPPVATVMVAGLADRLCGASRPGHFDGVATVVTKLLNIVSPDVVVFGRKDYQQLRLVRRLVEDLNLGVDVVGGPTVREPDGLALSSRNRRLDGSSRALATVLSSALRATVLDARTRRERGEELDPDLLRGTALGTIDGVDGVRIDYLEVVDPETLTPPDGSRGEDQRLLVAVAAYLGEVRLIDNVEVGDLDDEQRLLDATA